MKFLTVSVCLFCSLLLSACGFHLRGTFAIPPCIQVLKLAPDEPADPFQRILKQTLRQNGITVVDCGPASETAATLQLNHTNFVERAVAYGSDVQINRSTLQFNVSYQIVDAQGKVLICDRCIDMERDFTIDPNSVLGTESERNMVKTELYNDAATLLVRQLSLAGNGS